MHGCPGVIRENGTCPGCELYNAAVAAQQAAAKRIADYHDATDGLVNEYGFFGWVDNVYTQLRSKEEAAPFAKLTTEANRGFAALVKATKTPTKCPGCDQPMLPVGMEKKPNEYDHARGCPFDATDAALTKAGAK
jgi:hypothetical protein